MKVSIEYDKEFQELAQTAFRKWGSQAQIKMMCEECSELITVLLKRERKINPSTVKDVIEELVDVEIMLAEMKVLYKIEARNQDLWKKITDRKLTRFKEILEP